MGLIREAAGVARAAWRVRRARARQVDHISAAELEDLYRTGHQVGLDEHAVNETVAAWVVWAANDPAEIRRALIRRSMGAEWRPGVQP